MDGQGDLVAEPGPDGVEVVSSRDGDTQGTSTRPNGARGLTSIFSRGGWATKNMSRRGVRAGLTGSKGVVGPWELVAVISTRRCIVLHWGWTHGSSWAWV